MTASIRFDQAADYYDETRGLPPGVDRQIGALIAQAVTLTSESRLLEIGVGTGRIALPVAEHTGWCVGVDLAVPMMNKLRQKQAADFAKAHVSVVQGDVLHLPFALHTFDAALVVHILHLVGDMEQAVRELARVMKPGGKVIQCWNQDDKTTFAPLWDAWEGAVGNPNSPNMLDRWQGTLTIFERMGWTLSGEYNYPFTVQLSPDGIADRYRRRVYSSMWSMPDEVWQHGVEQLEDALRTHYADPHQPHEVRHEFCIRVYTF